MLDPNKHGRFNNPKKISSLKLRKVSKIGSFILLFFVMIMSGIGMWSATTSWIDTMWTCIWCLSLVTMVDRLD